MQDWLHRQAWRLWDLQGFDPERKGEFVWDGLLPQWATVAVLLAFAAACWLVFRTYRREGGAPPAAKWALAGVRCLLLVLALGFFLQPMWRVARPPKEETGLLIVLADESRSMGAADPYKTDDRRSLAGVTAGLSRLAAGDRPVSRTEVVNELLAAGGFDLLGKLEARNHRIKVYAFGAGNEKGVRELTASAPPAPATGGTEPAAKAAAPPRQARPDVAVSARAPTTELGSAVQYVYDKHRHEKIAGILILSDGRNVAGRRPEDAARDLARADVGVPLFAVAVGLPDPPRNIAVEKLVVNPSYFVRNPIPVNVRLRSGGYGGSASEIRLVIGGFTITDQYLSALRADGVPADVVTRISELPVRTFQTKEEFIDIVGKALPVGEADRHSVKLLKAAVFVPAPPVRITGSDKSAAEPQEAMVHPIKLRDDHWNETLPSFEIHKPGRYIATVEVPRREGESNADDNSETFEFEVRPDIRVLLVSGAMNWEFRYLKEFYRRQDLINVQTWLQTAPADYLHDSSDKADSPPLQALPADEASLGQYDLIVLIDPDPRPEAGLSANWFRVVKKLVLENGMGLLYIAGNKFAPYMLTDPNFEDSLIEMLPVKPDGLTQRAKDVRENRFHYWSLTKEGAAHSIPSQLSRDPRKLFDALPGFFFYIPNANPKTGATVLANPGGGSNAGEAGEHVLWAEQKFGTGMTMWLAGDNTWLWRSRADEVRRQFWLQTARYLTQFRGVKPGEKLRIETDRRDYRAGETVLITGFGAAGRTGEDGVEEVLVRWKGGSQTVALRRKPGGRAGAAQYQGFFVPAADGTYEIYVPRDSATDVARKFKVDTAGPEEADRTADPSTLLAMAHAARTGRIAEGNDNPGWHGLSLTVQNNRLVIEDVERDGPAVVSFKRGDVVQAVDHVPVKTIAEFEAALDRKRAGDRVELIIERGGLTDDPKLPLAPEPNFVQPHKGGEKALGKLLERVEPVKKKTPSRPKGRYLWDTWWLFGIFVGLMCVEWVVRKAYRLM